MPIQAILLVLAVLASTQSLVFGNLLKNPSFESDLEDVWTGKNVYLHRVTGDAVHGDFALKVSKRVKSTACPGQNVNLAKGSRYEVALHVKLLNDIARKLLQRIEVLLQFEFAKGEKGEYQAAYRLCNSSMGWIFVNGSFTAPMKDFSSARLLVRGLDVGVKYLMDNVSLHEVPENVNWFAEANANIDKYRKSNANVRFILPVGVRPSDFDVQVKLKRHQFAFGSLIKDTLITATPATAYSQLVYHMFNWATVQSYKWKFDKGTLRRPDYSVAVQATDVLNSHGLKVRGHSIFFDFAKNNPKAIVKLGRRSLQKEMDKHLMYMCNITFGKLAHWDVQNEHIRGQYYEERRRDPEVTKNIFRQAKQLVNNTKLYFNDVMGVLSGASTEGLTQLMKQYLSEGVPVDGLGIQGHSKPYIKPDPTMIWRRLDRLATTQLELFITEFDVLTPDDVERADWLEDAYRAFFAHPYLSGVVMWGFWDLDRRESENKDLVRGVNLTILEPGQRYICLVKKEWTTNLTRNLGDGLAFKFRGFQGDYGVVVRRNGIPVQTESFVLSNNDTAIIIRIANSTVHTMTFAITVCPNSEQVPVEEERDYVPRCVSHRGQVSLGQQTSVANDQQLTCHTVTSEASGEHDGDEVAVSCGVDEVMTGCNSYHNVKLCKRQGEKLEMKDGVLQCKGYNGGNSTAGVRAQARCCRLSGLTCEYRVAGPSLPFDGAQAEATCPSNTQPFGCSSYSRYPDMDGTYQDVNASSCVAQSGNPALADPAARSGSVVFASCCSRPSLNCIRVTSQETGLVRGDQQQVTCPSSYVMVSCAYFAPNGKSGGASIVLSSGKESCAAFMGANMTTGSSGVKATATCCKISV